MIVSGGRGGYPYPLPLFAGATGDGRSGACRPAARTGRRRWPTAGCRAPPPPPPRRRPPPGGHPGRGGPVSPAPPAAGGGGPPPPPPPRPPPPGGEVATALCSHTKNTPP